MFTLFNVGNTHTQIAGFDGVRIVLLDETDTRDFDPRGYSGPLAAASVVPSKTVLFPEGTFLLDSAKVPGLLSKMKSPETVGADRLANALALVAGGRLPALSVDFGTAITFELVDPDGCLSGGAILPGRTLLRRALHSYTAKLPLTELCDRKKNIPGNNTVDAIDIGCDTGAVGAVREILTEIDRIFPDVRKVACGGDRAFFRNLIPGFEEAPHDFTLRGLVCALRRSGGFAV